MGFLLSPPFGPLTFVLVFTIALALVLLFGMILGLPCAIPLVAVFPTLAELVDDELLLGLRIF